MRIVFYSTNSNNYRKGSVVFGMNPNCFQQFESLRKKFPEHEFFVVAEPPAMFLLDEENIEEKSTSGEEIEVFAQRILDLSPDLAIAVTYWTQPFDWMGIKDSLVGEILEGKGVRAIYHPVRTSEICFDKWQTHQFLEENGFNCAKGVYVHHQMFWAERNRNMVAQNVYREAIFSSIKKLKFPVVIKDVYGLSSYGMDVVQNFEQAKKLLLSKKNNGDRIVEEFLEGNSYGLEIYGSEGNYIVTPPLINSVNQFGLTSPKQNVKLGPILGDEVEEKFQLEVLQSEMRRLANLLHFNGIAQVDLLFDGKKWFVIEINSRISGMTQTMACSMGMSLYELILLSAGIFTKKKQASEEDLSEKAQVSCQNQNFRFVMNLKFPLLDAEKISRLMKFPFVFAVNRIENLEAKQLREMGYTEVIFGGTETLDETMEMLEVLNKEFPDDMVEVFYQNAKKLAEILCS